MAVVDDADRREEDFRREWEWAERAAEEAAKVRADEYKLERLKIATEPRQKTIVKCVVAIVKLPCLIILSILLPLLVLCHIEIPQFLADFMAL